MASNVLHLHLNGCLTRHEISVASSDICLSIMDSFVEEQHSSAGGFQDDISKRYETQMSGPGMRYGSLARSFRLDNRGGDRPGRRQRGEPGSLAST